MFMINTLFGGRELIEQNPTLLAFSQHACA
jgi:hypothetical protein